MVFNKKLNGHFEYLKDKATTAIIPSKRQCIALLVINWLHSSPSKSLMNKPGLLWNTPVKYGVKTPRQSYWSECSWVFQECVARPPEYTWFGRVRGKKQFPLHPRKHDQLIKYWLYDAQWMMTEYAQRVYDKKRIYNEFLTLADLGYDNFAKRINSILTQFKVNKAEIPTSSQAEITAFESKFRETRYL